MAPQVEGGPLGAAPATPQAMARQQKPLAQGLAMATKGQVDLQKLKGGEGGWVSST